MPTGRVVEPGEIYLNGRFYRLVGQVRRSLVSQLPPKVTLGEYDEASNPIASSITWSDLTQGMGQEVMNADDPPNKVFYADANIQAPGFITLPPSFLRAAVSTFNGMDARAVATTPIIGAASPNAYIGYSSSRSGGAPATPIVLQVYLDETGASIAGVVRALATDPLQVAYGQIGTGRYIAVPTGVEVDWSSNPFTCGIWNRNTTDISYVAFWRDLLWGFSTGNGGLYFTADLSGSWVQVATFLEFPVYGLLAAPAADNTLALYIITERGLFIFNPETERVEPTPLLRSFAVIDGKIPFSGWRGRIYIANRAIVYEYVPGAVPTINVLTPFPEAIPPEFDVPIRSIVPEFKDLLMLSASTALSSASATYQTVYAWNGETFRIVGLNVRSEAAPETANLLYHQSVTADDLGLGLLRVAKGQSSRPAQIQYANIPNDITRPSSSTIDPQLFSTGATAVLPWIQRTGNQEWLALEALLDVNSPSAEFPTHLDYGLDFSSLWTSMGFNSTTGEKAFQFPTTGDQTGTAFRAIRFRVRPQSSGAVTSASTLSPVLRKLVFSYLRKPRPLWGFDIVLDLTEDYKGYGPKQQREAIETAITSTPLVEFTYRDEADNTENHFVQVLAPESLEDAGRHERNTYRLRLTEAI